jgi:hypothetical protein
MEHWLESKGPLDDPKHEQGRQTLLEIARALPKAMSGGANIPRTISATLIEKIMASLPLPDPQKEAQRAELSTAASRDRQRAHAAYIGICLFGYGPLPVDAHDRNTTVMGQNEKTFLISWKPAQEVRQGLRKRALGMVFGGAALALFCLVLLLGHLHLY